MLVRQSTVAIKNSPGIKMIHQEPVINALSDKDNMLPQVIISIGRPIPIKLRVASEIMAVLTFITTINIIDEKKFGIRCFHIMRKNPAPIHLAAMIYSLFRICRTSVRITFAILVQLVTPITIERLTTIPEYNWIWFPACIGFYPPAGFHTRHTIFPTAMIPQK